MVRAQKDLKNQTSTNRIKDVFTVGKKTRKKSEVFRYISKYLACTQLTSFDNIFYKFNYNLYMYIVFRWKY